MKLGEKEVQEIMKFIEENDDFSIFYHLDGDGVTSATLLSTALSRLGKKVSFYRPTNYEDFENGIAMSEITKNIIICDLDGHPLQKNIGLFENRNVCLIDHHELITDPGFAYINPKMWGDMTYTPCALLVYKLFEKVISDIDWVAMIGWISDAGPKDNKEFGLSVLKKYSIPIGKHDFLLDTVFGEAAMMTNNMIIEHGRAGADEALGILLSSNSLAEFMENERIKQTSGKVDKNLKSLIEEFKTRSECVGDIIYFFEMDASKKRYSSTLSTALGLNEYRKNVVVIMTKVRADILKVNMRATELNVDIPSALRKIFEHIKGSGGGHAQASGAQIRPEDRDKFKLLFSKEIRAQLGLS